MAESRIVHYATNEYWNGWLTMLSSLIPSKFWLFIDAFNFAYLGIYWVKNELRRYTQESREDLS